MVRFWWRSELEECGLWRGRAWSSWRHACSGGLHLHLDVQEGHQAVEADVTGVAAGVQEKRL